MSPYVAAGIGTAVAAVTSPLVLAGLKRLKSRQTISEHVAEHAHKQGTPTMGGIMILIAFFVTSALTWSERSLQMVLLVIGFAILGFVDDFVVPRMVKGSRGLGWKEKLVLQVLVSVGVLSIHGFDWGFAALGTFLILFFSNAYNFSDGIDGLAATLGVILFACFLVPFFDTNLGMIGGFLVFLFWNKYPAKVFMGDVGALPIGALLGYQVFGSYELLASEIDPANVVGALVAVSLVMIAELVPVPLQILSVKLRGKRLFPKTPIHHAFQEKGWSEWKIVGVFGAAQLACVLLACLAMFYI